MRRNKQTSHLLVNTDVLAARRSIPIKDLQLFVSVSVAKKLTLAAEFNLSFAFYKWTGFVWNNVQIKKETNDK